jgi:hypothetical protein
MSQRSGGCRGRGAPGFSAPAFRRYLTPVPLHSQRQRFRDGDVLDKKVGWLG